MQFKYQIGRLNDPWVKIWIVSFVGLLAAAVVKLLIGVPSEVGWDLFVTGGGLIVVGVILTIVLTPTATQSSLLARIEQERKKLGYYERLIDGYTDGESDEGADENQRSPAESEETSPSDGVDTRDSGQETVTRSRSYRYKMANNTIEQATEAVFRHNYSTALELFYEASRHNLVLSDMLDVHETSKPRPEGQGSNQTESGDGESAMSERTENLVTRVKTFSEKMNASESHLVRGYLENSPVSSLDLYYALEVMHEWNVRQRKNVYSKKRYLRIAILLLLLFGVGIAVLSFASDSLPGAVIQTDAEINPGVLTGVILLVGGVGALFSVLCSVLRSLRKQGTEPSVPDMALIYEALLLRVLTGCVGALLFTVLIQTSVAGAILNTEFILDTGESGNPGLANLVLLAFVAGVSERLVKRALDRFVDTTLETGDDPDSSGASERDRGAITYISRGNAKAELEEYEDAIEEYTRAIELDTGDTAGYLNRAEARIQRGEFTDARRDAQSAASRSESSDELAESRLLELVSAIALGEDAAEEEERYRELCGEEFTTTRSFEELGSWLETADLEAERRDRIEELIDLLREHSHENSS